MPSNVSYKSLLEADVTDCCYRAILKVVVPISKLYCNLNIFVTMLILHRWRHWCYAWKRNPLYPIRVISFISVLLYLLHNAWPMTVISNMVWPSWPWWYGSWICNYPCNQCLSPLMLWVRILIRARCTTLCDTGFQWLAKGRCFSLCTLVSPTIKTDRHHINTIKSTKKQTNVLLALLRVNFLWVHKAIFCVLGLLKH